MSKTYSHEHDTEARQIDRIVIIPHEKPLLKDRNNQEKLKLVLKKIVKQFCNGEIDIDIHYTNLK